MNNITDFRQNNFKSSAQIINKWEVEVIAPNGEVFIVKCQIGLLPENLRELQLAQLEQLFDKYYCNDKIAMIRIIWAESVLLGIFHINGISVGTHHIDRIRIGKRIREIREEKKIDAKELAKLAGIDAANLSRIENGRYSVGFDILTKIATALGKKVDFVDI